MVYIYIYDIVEWFKNQGNNNSNRVPGAAERVETKRFQQSASTHSGVGEKETLNINVISINT